MLKYRNIIVCFFFAIYIILGLYLSITNGISHDQYHEQLNWKINFQAIKSVLFNQGDYQILLDYIDRYHGIAFHYISQPIQLLSNSFIGKLNNINIEGAYYLSRHAPIFIIFCVTGVFFYFLCLKISNSKNFSLISTIIFFLYPYFFGHAQINGKDIPFLSFWIICTYYLFNIIEKFYYEKKIKFINILLLSFFTAFLISIRITGSLILMEYLIALIVFLNLKNINLWKFILKNNRFFIIFIISIIIFVYFLNPIFWLNPLEFFKSIEWMGKYYHDTCTLTFGKCMSALNLPPSYLFIWLFFKLPILILIGLLIFPFIEKKIFNNNLQTIFYGVFLFTVLSLLFIFILKKVALYDEIRHVMFLVPFIFLISLYNIYLFNKKFFYSSSVILIIFFVVENISLKKYQYTWLNSFAKFTDIQKNFEIDYWGVSNKNLAKKIIEYSKKKSINKNTCVYGDIYAKEFLLNDNFKCFKTYSQLDAAKVKPLFAYQIHRNVKRSDPKDCKLIWDETYQYSFYNKNISVGKLWFCN